MKSPTMLSVAAPVFNEEEVLPLFIQELTSVCDSLDREYEIILVDDGSRDKTFELAKEEAAKNDKIKVVRFSRNFGHQAAVGAGIDFSVGDMVIIMDSDLQHPPKLIPKFIELAEAGNDIVIAERLSNKDNLFLRNIAGRLVYKFLSFMTKLEFRDATDFALYKKPVVEALKSMPEKERFFRGMVQWVGFKKVYLPYIAENRKGGTSKYSFRRILGFIMNGVTSFSAFPLRLAFWVGFLVFIASIIFSLYVVWLHFFYTEPLISGWATLAIFVLFLGGIQLMLLGVFGEYLYKMFNEVKGRPQYIVYDTKNIKKNG